jgi:hypothetical protein
MCSEQMETTEDADVPCQALTLVAQLPELSHLDPAQRRPAAEQDRHALVAAFPRLPELLVVEC